MWFYWLIRVRFIWSGWHHAFTILIWNFACFLYFACFSFSVCSLSFACFSSFASFFSSASFSFAFVSFPFWPWCHRARSSFSTGVLWASPSSLALLLWPRAFWRACLQAKSCFPLERLEFRCVFFFCIASVLHRKAHMSSSDMFFFSLKCFQSFFLRAHVFLEVFVLTACFGYTQPLQLLHNKSELVEREAVVFFGELRLICVWRTRGGGAAVAFARGRVFARGHTRIQVAANFPLGHCFHLRRGWLLCTRQYVGCWNTQHHTHNAVTRGFRLCTHTWELNGLILHACVWSEKML